MYQKIAKISSFILSSFPRKRVFCVSNSLLVTSLLVLQQVCNLKNEEIQYQILQQCYFIMTQPIKALNNFFSILSYLIKLNLKTFFKIFPNKLTLWKSLLENNLVLFSNNFDINLLFTNNILGFET